MFLTSHQNREGPRVAHWGTACPTCYRVVSPRHTALTKKGRQAEGHPSDQFSPRPGRTIRACGAGVVDGGGRKHAFVTVPAGRLNNSCTGYWLLVTGYWLRF